MIQHPAEERVAAANPESVRLDKWLWAVRLFKTRPLATLACRAGQVLVDGHAAKASREVRPGQIVVTRFGELKKTVEVLRLTTNRVSAPQSVLFAKDLTSPEDYERAKLVREDPMLRVPRGLGRPTKKQRRAIERIMVGLSGIPRTQED